ncbi:TMV resistance protein N [Vitis vinifera]|uniref:TMV resistance protein N n=1 Tax=Vitis vinifera TaxID=29760 RepID=A0A438DTU7_VITVI|nr:TMV resistance protein N [Vitis vinifera]
MGLRTHDLRHCVSAARHRPKIPYLDSIHPVNETSATHRLFFNTFPTIFSASLNAVSNTKGMEKGSSPTKRDDEELEKGGDIASDLLRAIEESSFGDALAYHERDANQEKKEMIQKWRIALRKAANLSGCHVNDQYETEVVKEIVDTIIRRLNHQPLSVGKNIVGIGVHLEKLKSLMNTELNMVSVVGIYGIGGVGKTTIAKAIYNEISHQYDGSSFL